MNCFTRDIYDVMESQPTYEHYIEINDILYNYEKENMKQINKIQMIRNTIRNTFHEMIPCSYCNFYNFVYNKY